MQRELGRVVDPRAQRRQHDFGNREPIEQILAKRARIHALGERAARCGDHVNVDGNRAGRSDATDLTRFEHAQQSRLPQERQIGDFVDEDRPAVGFFEEPDPILTSRR